MSTVTFLGTGGARVLVFKQLLASGGLWLDFEGTRLSLDPGPGALVQATKRKLYPTQLSGIILSHRHLDHSSDVNAMIEGMTTGGLEPKGTVFAPHDALEEDPVVLRYLRSYVERMVTLHEGGEYEIGSVRFRTPVRHRHPVETYGFIFQGQGPSLGVITDTAYFPELAEHYRADYLIVNVVLMKPFPAEHLTIEEAKRLIAVIRPKQAVLTHFGMSVWRAKPWEIAARLTEETGVQVKAARDGMRLELF